MKKNLNKERDFLEFALSNTVDPINALHLTGRIKSLKARVDLNKVFARSGVTVGPLTKN